MGYFDSSGFISCDSPLDSKNIFDTNTARIVPSIKAEAMAKNATISHLIFVVVV